MGHKIIPLFKVHMPEEVLGAIKKTLFSGFIGEGPKVEEFERSISKFLKAKFVLTTNNCTSAIQLALRLAGVSCGDEVISTAMTCTATNEPVMAAGGRIVWADINPKTGNINPASIRKKITKKTKAIIVVHWGGYPVDLDEINSIAREYDLKVIEDAAHAFGAEYHDKKIGSHSDYVCFSFQAIKHITTVDGGVLVVQDKKNYQRGKLLRWYGIDRQAPRRDFRYGNDIPEWGYKFHMNDVLATIGVIQLKYIQSILEHRRKLAAYYDRELQFADGVTLCDLKKDRLSSYWLYTILVEKRDEFMNYMQSRGIMVSQVHARNDKHTMFKDFRAPLPGVDEFTRKMVCIPIGFWISEKECRHIVSSIRMGW